MLMLDIRRIEKFVVSFRDNQSRRVIAENLLSLTVLQYVSYLFPLLVVPYLTRVIGVERFGSIAFAQAFMAYLTVLVNYGFSFSATRQVSIARHDAEALQRIFSQVLWAKLCLACISLFLLFLFMSLYSSARSELLLFVCCYTAVIGNALAPEWFFQGIERMKYITAVGLLSRTAATVMVFVVVRCSSDYLWVPILNGIGAIVGACLGTVMIWRDLGISILKPNLRGVVEQLRDGFDTFLSNGFISLYTTTNAFLLGLMAGPTQVGYYSAAEKVVAGLRSLWGPVPQVLFPRFAKVYSTDQSKGKRYLRLVLIVASIATLAISTVGIVTAPMMVHYYLGPQYQPCVIIIQVLAVSIFAIGVNNILGVQGLLASGMSRAFRNIVIVSGVLNVMLLIPCVRLYGSVGPAISVVVVELSIAVAQLCLLRKRQLV